MPCPNSPEDGFHRYTLPSTGKTLTAACQYCGQPKTYRPVVDPAHAWTDKSGNKPGSAAKGLAAQQAKQEV